MSLYLIKHHILIRMRFIDKSQHVMYYLPFDRLMGLWIINEFLKGLTVSCLRWSAINFRFNAGIKSKGDKCTFKLTVIQKQGRQHLCSIQTWQQSCHQINITLRVWWHLMFCQLLFLKLLMVASWSFKQAARIAVLHRGIIWAILSYSRWIQCNQVTGISCKYFKVTI